MFCVILKIVIFVIFFENIAGESASNRSICGPETELRLEGSGANSSAIVTLDPESKTFPSTCKLRVLAPESHIIYISIIKDEDLNIEEEEEEEDDDDEKQSDTNCLLSVYVPENRRAAVWRSDMCSPLTLNEGPLVPPQARLVWTLPRTRTKGSGVKSLVLTALARGDHCTRSNTHACLKLGWTPLTCIAQELVCDGVVNCPGGGHSDEDPELCREKKTLSKTSWEKIASEFFKKFAGKSQNGAGLVPISNDGTNWFLGRDAIFRNPVTTEKNSKTQFKPRNRQETDTLGGLLGKYGPWGYLMLGMLVCGAALMVCGLWECCCRKEKPPGSNRIPTRPPSSVPQSTTVLIISNSQGSTAHGEEASQGPPNYEDLDQPPSYGALFPPDK